MDVIIVCHTEFGYIRDRALAFEKDHPVGVEQGVPNLIDIADKYGAKVTFAVCPEVVEYFPRGIKHEIGLHIHPGWVQSGQERPKLWIIGDSYLKEHCQQSVNSTALRDYPYAEQLNMIKTGKEYLERELSIEPKVFVAGRWCEDNNTIKALVEAGFTHSCSATRSKTDHYDWSRLPRICMPYHPSQEDYQKRGSLPLLIVPISHMLLGGAANPEEAPYVGLPWLKACFLEYYRQDLPLFHICLHSPCGTDDYFLSAMDKLLGFISRHKKVNFKFASEVVEYKEVNPKTDILPYIFGINRAIVTSYLEWGLTIPRRVATKCWK